MPDDHTRKLAALREEAAEAERLVAANAAALAAASTRLAKLGLGGAAAQRRRLQREVERLELDRRKLVDTRRERLLDVERLREELLRRRGHEDLIAALPADVPFVLLPVRIETRFTADRSRLRVRVFPDPIHVPDHDPELTPPEREAGERYWRARWSAADDAEARAAAWTTLARALTPPRAMWVAQVLTPTNLEQLGTAAEPALPQVPLRAGPWHRAAPVELLPDRWVVLGWSGGAEVLRKWGNAIPEELVIGPEPDPAADADPETSAPPDAEQGELPGEGMRWLVDYDEAERVGMAVTVEQADLRAGELGDGFDHLVVLGADPTLAPDDGAARLGGLLDRHAFSGGLSVLRQGTPTNATGEARPEPGLARGDGEALDPDGAASAADERAGSARLARALGLPAPGALAGAPGGAAREDLDAHHMHNALWEATWGYFLDQAMDPLVEDEVADRLRAFACRYVRGRGPLPALRVGDQPYGVLPVVAGERWRPRADGDLEHQIQRRLAAMRPLWARAAGRAPVLGRSPRPDRDLVEVLATTPRSAAFRFREVVGPVVQANTFGFDPASVLQELIAQALAQSVGLPGTPFAARATLAVKDRRLTAPLVHSEALSEDMPLPDAANYIRAVLAEARAAGGFQRMLRKKQPHDTLLHILLDHSAQLEIAKSAARLVHDFEIEAGGVGGVRRKVAPVERELHGVEKERPPARGGAISKLEEARSLTEVAQRSLGAVSGRQSLANYLATTDVKVLRKRRPTRRFVEFLDSLEHLAGLPTASLERLLTETLDCASHRLDAWLTSLAASRLDHLRGVRATGVHLGAFGWVDGVRPSAEPVSQGYVHAPSLPQATTAAVLRSGHLGHRQSDPGALAVDLSSERVRRALEIVDGVRNGQPVGALLGYRFERALRERRLTLARYILPLRRLAPLATSTDAREGTEPLEAIAARDVVDGVRLIARWKAGADAFFGQPDLPRSGPDRDDLQAELERLDDVLDATGDLLLAEGVHQAVSGNAQRAGAALNALDRQTDLPEVQVVRTPREATGFNHRLVVLLGDDAAPEGWPTDPRGAAEPRLNAWVARVLGPPGNVRFAAEVLAADGQVLQRPHTNLGELGLSPLAAVLALGTAARDAAGELEERLALKLGDLVTAGADAARLRILDEPPAGSPAAAIGLGELRTLARSLVDLVSSSRHATASDLGVESERLPSGLDDAELKARADRAVEALRRAGGGLDGLPAGARPPRLRAALLEAAGAGVRAAVPAAPDAEGLREQVDAARAAIARTLTAVEAGELEFDRDAADPAGRVAHDLARLHAVFGAEFPAVPRFAAANGPELVAARGARRTLLDGDDVAPAEWLGRMALVRPSVARLDDVVAAAEALERGVKPGDLAVFQLPHAPGDRWLGLPLPEERTLPRGRLSIVAYAPTGLDPAAPLAGFVVDQWTERLPASTQTTGLSFHFDAPGSRAPQALLVAVPPDPTAARWDFDSLVASVREARELTGMRLVDLQSVEGAARFLPALWFPFNLQADVPSIDWGMLQNRQIELDNQAFLARGGNP